MHDSPFVLLIVFVLFNHMDQEYKCTLYRSAIKHMVA